MEEEQDPVTVRFYAYPQSTALTVFLPALALHFPYSNPMYNRIQAPHNIPSRHCLFASTIPPDTVPPENYTIVFSDRNRRLESQIWIFNSLVAKQTSLSPSEKKLLREHVHKAILFLKNTEIKDAPGWPFDPRLKFAMLPDAITEVMLEICEPMKAVIYSTIWNTWLTRTSTISSAVKKRRNLPEGYQMGRVPDDQIDLVISTSSIPRQAATLRSQPSIGLLNEEQKLVAWGYVGIDGSFATLYVMPEQRGKGLASFVAVELLETLGSGGFSDLGYAGISDWVHSDVYAGNSGSEGVMKSLGAKIWWKSSYIHIDSDML